MIFTSDEWKLGTIREHDLLELYRTDTCKRFIESSHAAVPQCQDCRWKFLCRGGCRRDRDMTPGGSLERNYYCEAYADLARTPSRLVRSGRLSYKYSVEIGTRHHF